MVLEPADLQPGGTVDHYRLERTVHRGRHAVVFAAVDERTGDRVALKALGEHVARDPADRQRFIAEAQLAARLGGHPHIVRVHGWGQHGDHLYYVTDFVDGVSLAAIMARREPGDPLPPAEALPLLAQLADALDTAHGRGVVHGDVRPANVMVRMTETTRSAYLVDFGISKELGAASSGNTSGAHPDYAAPEHVTDGPLDHRADVYALACTAFELLTGQPPYAGAPNDAARLAAHAHGEIPLASALVPTLPRAADDVLTRALAKRPDDRHPSAGELVRALRAAFPLAAVDDVRPTLVPVGAAPILAGRDPEERPRRRRWPLAVAALVVIAGVGAGVAALVGGGDDSAAGVATSEAPTTAATPTTTPTPTPAPTTAAPTTTAAPRPVVTAPVTVTAAPTTAAPTTASPTTRPVEIGPFGIPVGAPVDADVGPEAAFAIHAHERTAPTDVVVAGSPADLYAAWLRATTPAGSEPVVATARGFRIVADEPVELQGFVVEDGRISSFEECTGDVCIPLADHVVAPPECQPGEGCPHVRSATGAITAEQRAILTQRWPQQVVVYELVVDAADGRSIAAVDEPTQQHFRYEPATQLFVATFPDRPAPGTRTQLSITFDDGTTDTLLIYYGA